MLLPGTVLPPSHVLYESVQDKILVHVKDPKQNLAGEDSCLLQAGSPQHILTPRLLLALSLGEILWHVCLFCQVKTSSGK